MNLIKLRYVEFVLDNCDVIRIDKKYIEHFYIGNIRKVISKIDRNIIVEDEICDTFFIEIHSSANTDYYQFGIETDPKFKTKKFERLKENDITCVNLGVGDGKDKTHLRYFIEWERGDEYQNSHAESFEGSLGNLYILISKDEKLTDYIDTAE